MDEKLKSFISLGATLSLIAGAVFLFAFNSTAQNRAQQDAPRHIITFQDNVSDFQQEQIINRAGGQTVHSYDIINGAAVVLPDGAANALTNSPQVKSLEKDKKVRAIHHKDGHSRGGPNNGGDDQPGFTVEPTSGLQTSEDETQDTFNVVLDTQPTATVTIPNIYSSDTSEGTANPNFLTFDATNWDSPQTVTVTGVDDSSQDGDISYTIITDPATSNDPDYDGLDPDDVSATNLDNESSQVLPWGVDRIDAEQAWNNSAGMNIDVAVIDTGVDLDHPDLDVFNAVDCTKGPNCEKAGDGDDDNGHGTHVSGTIAALYNNIGVVGTAPGALLNGVKVLDQSGGGKLSDLIEGLDWAVQNNMQVANMSLSLNGTSNTLHNAVQNAYNQGLTMVAAAGNESSAVAEPASYPEVIAVSATNQNDNLAAFSNFGSTVELAAPGTEIYSTFIGGGYEYADGTSMAAPHVTGTVALVLATPISDTYDSNSNNLWEIEELRSKLQDTAEDLGVSGKDDQFGYGLVDALAATS